MSLASDTIVIGKIGAPYGVKGWVKITTYTDETQGVFEYSPWLLGDGKKEYIVDLWRTHNKGVIAKLVGVESRDDAESIKNAFSSGVVDYVTKPFNPVQLLARIKTHIKLKKQTEELELQNANKNKFLSILFC